MTQFLENDHNFKADSNDKVGGEVCEHRKANVICLHPRRRREGKTYLCSDL